VPARMLLAVVLASYAAIAPGQQLADRKAADIVRASVPPILDGSLDDPVWSSATVIRDLHQYDPVDHGPPSEDSTFYLLYDDDYLYIGARLLDGESEQISARQMIQDQSVNVDDYFEFIIDPFDNMRAGYKFQVNPNGIRRDGIFETVQDVNEDWDGIWFAEATIDDQAR